MSRIIFLTALRDRWSHSGQSIMTHKDISPGLKQACLAVRLLMADLTTAKWCKTPEKWPKPWHMGTRPRVLSKSFLMDTNMTRFRSSSKITETCLKPWHVGTHLRELRESYSLNTNMTGFRWFSNFQQSLHPCALDENSLSIGRASGKCLS